MMILRKLQRLCMISRFFLSVNLRNLNCSNMLSELLNECLEKLYMTEPKNEIKN